MIEADVIARLPSDTTITSHVGDGIHLERDPRDQTPLPRIRVRVTEDAIPGDGLEDNFGQEEARSAWPAGAPTARPLPAAPGLDYRARFRSAEPVSRAYHPGGGAPGGLTGNSPPSPDRAGVPVPVRPGRLQSVLPNGADAAAARPAVRVWFQPAIRTKVWATTRADFRRAGGRVRVPADQSPMLLAMRAVASHGGRAGRLLAACEVEPA